MTESHAKAGGVPAVTGHPETTSADPDIDPGQSDVDAAVKQHLALLDGVADRPLTEHADRFDQVHTGLQAALAEIDDVS